MIDLVEEIENLDAFFHVSTLFSFEDQELLEEKVPHNLVSFKISDYVNVLNNNKINKDDFEIMICSFEKELYVLLKNYSNTYTLSKTLAECLVNERCNGKLPTIIVRPPSIAPSSSEPEVGWYKGIQLYLALIAAYSFGILQIGHFKYDWILPTISVDILGNLFLASIVKLNSLDKNNLSDHNNNEKGNIVVVNAAPEIQKLSSVYQLFYALQNIVTEFPSAKIIRPIARLEDLVPRKTNDIIFRIKRFVKETVFAYIFDVIGYVIGQKQK